MSGSVRRLHTGVAELSGLLTGGVTPTRCDSLSRAVQMVRCELCMPKVDVVESLNPPPPHSFFSKSISHDVLASSGKERK